MAVAETSWTDFLAPLDAPVRYGVVPVLKDARPKSSPRPNGSLDLATMAPPCRQPLKPWFQPRHDLGTMAVACDRQDRKPGRP